MSDVDANEGRFFMFEEFSRLMRTTAVIGVVKFWSLLLRSVEETPSVTGKPVSVEDLVDQGGRFVRRILAGVDAGEVIARIKQGDIDSGQTTDVSFLDEPPEPAASKGSVQ